jgi:hypothetical protein
MRRMLAFVTAVGLAVSLSPLVLADRGFADEGQRPDRGKRLLEAPLERVIPAGDRETGGGVDGENPAVAPGAIRWHDGLAAARTASKASGRPVLLFQLLGRLDQEFC